MKEYDKYQDLLLDLIGGDNTIAADIFSGADLGNLVNKQEEFWKEFSKLMTSEEEWLNNNGNNHWFIRQNDFNKSKQSVMDYIAKKSDRNFNISDFESITHWNKSIDDLIRLYEKINNTDGTVPNEHGGFFYIKDILNADAGNTYGQDNINDNLTNQHEIDNLEWVKAWLNIDEESYKEVRNIDAIIPVLNSSHQSQFTRLKQEDLSKKEYLRLIMPKYLRRVEVEDLNRNFWVIAQTLSALAAYLLNPDSPLSSILNGLLDEITQLWQNILYLWVAAALVTQESKYTDIKTIHCYLDNSEIQPFLKYDNFDNTYTINSNNMLKRIKHYSDEYPKSNLIIIPEVRSKNYQHNYYAAMIIPYIFTYDRNKKEWNILSTNSIINIDLTNLNSNSNLKIGGISINENTGNYIYTSNWLEPHTSNYYYSLIRTKIEIESTYTDKINISKLVVYFEDAAAALAGYNSYIETFAMTSITDSLINFSTTYGAATNNKVGIITKGHYQGELISYYKKGKTIFIPKISKSWNGAISSATATFTLSGTGQSVTINYPNTSANFSAVDAYDSNDNLISYLITENSLGEYWTQTSPQTINYNVQTAYFSNTYSPITNISVYFTNVGAWAGTEDYTATAAANTIAYAQDSNGRYYHSYGDNGTEEWWITMPYTILRGGIYLAGDDQGWFYDRYYICHRNSNGSISETEVFLPNDWYGLLYQCETNLNVNAFYIPGDPTNNYNGYLTNVADPYSSTGYSRRVAFGGEGTAVITNNNITIQSLMIYHWDMGAGERIDTGSGIGWINRSLSDIRSGNYDGHGYWILNCLSGNTEINKH